MAKTEKTSLNRFQLVTILVFWHFQIRQLVVVAIAHFWVKKLHQTRPANTNSTIGWCYSFPLFLLLFCWLLLLCRSLCQYVFVYICFLLWTFVFDCTISLFQVIGHVHMSHIVTHISDDSHLRWLIFPMTRAMTCFLIMTHFDLYYDSYW